MSAEEGTFQAVETTEEAPSCYRNRLYEPLPSGRYIRVLLIEPGGPDDPVACKLNTIALDEAHFEAISYAWGTTSMTEHILCNDISICITANLRDALVQARRKFEPRALWADSICINQEDKDEKGQQVALMADIYKKSSCTLICLGKSDAEAHALPAAGLVADVNDMMDGVFQDESFSWEPDSFPMPGPDEPLLSDARWESVATLAGQPWFHRAWVVQEAALGPDARILWGDVESSWFQLLRACSWVRSRAFTIEHRFFRSREISRLHLATFETRRNGEATAIWGPAYHPSLNMLQILNCARALGVTDGRDRIYACLGLPNSTPTPPELTPTYHGTHLEVYREFAHKYLESTDMDLEILLHIQHNQESLGDTKFGSWIPRWDLWNTSCVFRYNAQPVARVSSYETSGARRPSLVDQNTLKVQGVCIGAVRFISPPFTHNTDLETVRHICQDALSMDPGTDQESNYSPQASTLEALVQTLAAGSFDGSMREWPQRRAAYARFLQGEDRTKEDIAADVTLVHNVIQSSTHNRIMIVTDRGHYGLAPLLTCAGDLVYAIIGAKLVYILRHTERDHHYRFVGDSYVLSKAEAEDNQFLRPFGVDEKFNDWTSWGLEEEEICLC